MPASLKLLRIATVAAVVAVSGSALAQDRQITIGWTAWSDAEAVTELARAILEDRMGYDVTLTMADIGIQYQGVASGELDAMLMAWLPVTHQNYWQRVSDQVVNLGVLYTRARLGWLVPDYVPADQVASLSDLADPEVASRLNRRIQGIDPGAGLMQASERALEAYGLDDYELVSASGAAMTAALERAIRRDEWIVVTGWSPHWKFAKWDLRYLDDPQGVLGGLERIHVLARHGFYQDYPEAAEFLIRMNLPLDDLEAIMFEADDTSYEEAVAAYIAANEARVNYWVTGRIE